MQNEGCFEGYTEGTSETNGSILETQDDPQEAPSAILAQETNEDRISESNTEDDQILDNPTASD
jgi:hypothetical protein